eukprot:3308895-Amphidinium_carterae.1
MGCGDWLHLEEPGQAQQPAQDDKEQGDRRTTANVRSRNTVGPLRGLSSGPKDTAARSSAKLRTTPLVGGPWTPRWWAGTKANGRPSTMPSCKSAPR